MSWFSKLKKGLSKTASLFSFTRADAESLEQMEEALIRADVGYSIASETISQIQKQKPENGEQVRQILKEVLLQKMGSVAQPLVIDRTKKPFIILMIGVNGAGKTTTIGKLGQIYQKAGLRVAFVAGDTFRAGATEQLCRWGERLSCPVYTAKPGADSAALAFEAIQKSRDSGDDVLLIDTAGRLQNRSDLMEELKKMVRVIQKQDPTAPHATVLVLDATVGQNAISQVKTFQEMVGVTGLMMTKLDGTAKGGILVALADQFHLPIHAVGVGESVDDLNPFTAAEYIDSLLGDPS